MISVAVDAYAQVRDGWSVDRVLLDPTLNALFVAACLKVEPVASRFEFNWMLMHARKNGFLTSITNSRRFVLSASRLEEFSFASEMAARRIQEQQWRDFGRGVSLDRIFCDPLLAEEFDQLAGLLAPGYSPLEYRWAALSLRKARRAPATMPRLRPDDFEDLGYTREIQVGQLPKAGGLYCFSCEGTPVYAGRARSLRRQVEIHFERTGVSVVPDWLIKHSSSGMRLQIAPISGMTGAWGERLKAAHVANCKPRLNWAIHPSLFEAWAA